MTIRPSASIPSPQSSSRSLPQRFMADEAGVTSIEYCFIAVFVSIASVAVWNSMGTNLNARYASILPGLTR